MLVAVKGFVRVAGAGDGARVALVQQAAWEGAYAALLPAGAVLDLPVAAQVWETAAANPPSPEHRLLVAHAGADRDAVVGFTAVLPGTDPDAAADPDLSTGQVLALHVHPSATGQGHGSRLVAAAVDHARTYGWDGLTAWVLDGDRAMETWLVRAGWEGDGASRVLDGAVKEHRLRVWVL
jgi:GNAT superfamily N-acetyltransferase